VVSFGITGDYDHAPDIQIIADGIGAGMAELLEAAAAAAPAEVVDLNGQPVKGTVSTDA
jgi:hypothetical protein